MITVSIVSHGHGHLIRPLLLRLLEFPEVSQLIVTINIPELIFFSPDSRVRFIYNEIPLGYGANHNKAFAFGVSTYFCALNPDISFITNPFPKMLEPFLVKDIGLVAPMVKNSNGFMEDTVRHFPTPVGIIARCFLKFNDSYVFSEGDPNFMAEWVGGMFMLFRSSAYAQIFGFDERYFMYVEDVDICTRLWKADIKIMVCPSAVVIHDANRASHRNWRHMCWHIASLLRYFSLYAGRLPLI